MGQPLTNEAMLEDLEEHYAERDEDGKLVLSAKERMHVGKEIRLLRAQIEQVQYSLTGDKEAEDIIAEMDRFAEVA